MPVYRANPTRKKSKLPAILALIFILGLIALLLVIGARHSRDRALAMAEAEAALADDAAIEGPETALSLIYEENDTRGVSTLNNVVLEEQFGICIDDYLRAWGCYSSGTYGLADVFIFLPNPGEENLSHLREHLEQIKTNRIVEAQSYNIYNALEHAEEGQIFEVGDYICLIMIENADHVRGILEDCLAED